MRLHAAVEFVLAVLMLCVLSSAQCVPCQHNGGSCIHWSQSAPPSGHDYTVAAGTTEYVDVSDITLDNAIIVQGTLVFACDMPVHLTCKRIEVANGGVLQIGTTGNRAIGPVVITLYGQDIDRDDPERTIDVMGGGRIELHGDTRGNTTCWTTLTETAGFNSNALILDVSANMNWLSGDKIVVASTDFPKVTFATQYPHAESILDQTEMVTVNDRMDFKVFLQNALQYTHFGQWVDSSVDERAEVGLLNRSIRIEGQGTDRGQLRFMADANGPAIVHIDWTEFTNLGDKAFKVAAHPSGGYPIHFHMMGSVSGSYVKYCSSHHNWHNNLVIHDTKDLLVEGNVFYDTVGWHVWFQENGRTCTGNTITGNLALVAREDTSVVLDDIEEAHGLGQTELGHAACFYIRNLNNTVIGNHAVSSQASGFYVQTVEPWVPQQSNSPWGYVPYQTMGAFAGNVAHSCADHGFYMGGYTELTPDYPNVNTTTFSDFTAYKNCGFAVHCRNFGACVWTNPQLADLGEGVYLASGGFWERPFQAVGLIKNGKIIGESDSNLGLAVTANEQTHQRSLANGRRHNTFAYGYDDAMPHQLEQPGAPGRRLHSPRELIGMSVYDGMVLIDTMAFSKFSDASNISMFAGAIGPAMYINPWAMDTRNSIRGCTFDSTSPIYLRPYTLAIHEDGTEKRIQAGINNTVLNTRDACIPGTGGSGTLFPSGNPLLSKGGTSTGPIRGMKFLPATHPFGQVMMFEGDGSAVELVGQKNLVVNYNGGVDEVLQIALAALPGGNLTWNTTGDGGPILGLHAWNAVISLPSGGNPVIPAHVHVITVSSPAAGQPGSRFTLPFTLMLTGNQGSSMADFEIPISPSGSVIASTADTRVGSWTGTTLQGQASLANWASSQTTAFYHDSVNNKIFLRIMLPYVPPPSNYEQNWGSICNGAPVYVYFK